jgi:hypothetical protein
MADYELDKQDIANIIGKTYRQTSKILHREISQNSGKPYVFDMREAVKIVVYFRNRRTADWDNKHPNASAEERNAAILAISKDISIDTIFFAEVFSIESIPA